MTVAVLSLRDLTSASGTSPAPGARVSLASRPPVVSQSFMGTSDPPRASSRRSSSRFTSPSCRPYPRLPSPPVSTPPPPQPRQVYRGRVSAGRALAERRQRDQEAALASSQREILRLQQQLGDRQSTLDTVLQSKQDLEAELGVVWEAATREEQGMRETLLNNSPSRGVQSLGLLGRTGPDWFSEAAEPSAPHKAHHHHSANEIEKLGLDFYS
ncbi:unnamed protein product [Arctogadus glacialis]